MTQKKSKKSETTMVEEKVLFLYGTGTSVDAIAKVLGLTSVETWRIIEADNVKEARLKLKERFGAD